MIDYSALFCILVCRDYKENDEETQPEGPVAKSGVYFLINCCLLFINVHFSFINLFLKLSNFK